LGRAIVGTCPVTKKNFYGFVKLVLKPLDIIKDLWHNNPVADKDEKKLLVSKSLKVSP